MGCSSVLNARRLAVLARPRSLKKAAALVNSLKNTSGLAAVATTCLKTTSVTPSMGASTKNGRGKSCQKFFIVSYYTLYMAKKTGKALPKQIIFELQDTAVCWFVGA